MVRPQTFSWYGRCIAVLEGFLRNPGNGAWYGDGMALKCMDLYVNAGEIVPGDEVVRS